MDYVRNLQYKNVTEIDTEADLQKFTARDSFKKSLGPMGRLGPNFLGNKGIQYCTVLYLRRSREKKISWIHSYCRPRSMNGGRNLLV